MPRRISAVFLDDGGVLNDNSLRSVEWQRLVGEFFAPRLGGNPEAWGKANHDVFFAQFDRFRAWLKEAGEDFFDFFGSGEERAHWVREMCKHVGVDAPADGVALAIEAEDFVLPRVRSAYPDVTAAVRELHARGYKLSTASSGTSRELRGHLLGTGVRDLFGDRLYGTDLVGALKNGPTYYRRIFAREGIDPAAALVLDDSPDAMRWIGEAGATPVLVARDGVASVDGVRTIPNLSALLSLLDGI
jgi:beta-phosphoglucomutase-like phosphatase (HAD superfamily)